MSTVRRPRALAALLLICAVALTGCRGLTDVRLPGGNAGEDPYTVNVIFDDVLNLEQQAAVRVNDVAVGDVSKVRIQGFKAKVTLRIRKDIVLPKNTFAELRQTSLFGEKFVALGPPPAPEQPRGRLEEGAVIDRSGRNPETEEVLAALSALLNGGGIAQLQTISVELSNALAGRESRVRDALRQVNSLVGALDDRKNEIVRALENVDALANRLARQRGTIASALDNIPPALAVLTDQRTQLTKMLTSLSNLGVVADDVIKNSRENTVQVLNDLQPILTNLDAAKTNIVSSLELLTNYPFPSTVKDGIHGDYAGLYASINLNVSDLVRGLTSNQSGAPGLPNIPNPLPIDPDLGPLDGVLGGGGGGTAQQRSLPTQPQQRSGNQGVLPDLGGLTGQSAGGSGYARVMLAGVTP
jgi:phospholipid/cholesterol/gamma-HCH transport system substrate-binding protein